MVFTNWQAYSIKLNYKQIGPIKRISLAGSACLAQGAKIGRDALTQEWLGRLSLNWCVLRDQEAIHMTHAVDWVLGVLPFFVSLEWLDGLCSLR